MEVNAKVKISAGGSWKEKTKASLARQREREVRKMLEFYEAFHRTGSELVGVFVGATLGNFLTCWLSIPLVHPTYPFYPEGVLIQEAVLIYILFLGLRSKKVGLVGLLTGLLLATFMAVTTNGRPGPEMLRLGMILTGFLFPVIASGFLMAYQALFARGRRGLNGRQDLGNSIGPRTSKEL